MLYQVISKFSYPGSDFILAESSDTWTRVSEYPSQLLLTLVVELGLGSKKFELASLIESQVRKA